MIAFILSILLIHIPIFLLIFKSFIYNSEFSLYWFKSILQDRNMWISIFNSIKLATISSSIGCAISIFNMYNSFYYISLIPLLVPEIMISIVILIFYKDIFSPDILLIIGHTTLSIAYISIVLRSVYSQRNKSIEEASMDLGATPFSTFKRITLPMMKFSIIESWCIAFSISMDDVILSSILGNRVTFPIELYSRMKLGVQHNINALLTIMYLFFIVSFLLFNLIRKR